MKTATELALITAFENADTNLVEFLMPRFDNVGNRPYNKKEFFAEEVHISIKGKGYLRVYTSSQEVSQFNEQKTKSTGSIFSYEKVCAYFPLPQDVVKAIKTRRLAYKGYDEEVESIWDLTALITTFPDRVIGQDLGGNLVEIRQESDLNKIKRLIVAAKLSAWLTASWEEYSVKRKANAAKAKIDLSKVSPEIKKKYDTICEEMAVLKKYEFENTVSYRRLQKQLLEMQLAVSE